MFLYRQYHLLFRNKKERRMLRIPLYFQAIFLQEKIKVHNKDRL